MPEPCLHQAVGLQTLALQRSPRLLAVASHGQQQGELPLLWGLCRAWVEHDLSVLVLDGHTPESAANPGLQQRLEDPWQDWDDAAIAPGWQVWPAALGLRPFANADQLAQGLSALARRVDIVLIYARAAALTRWLAGSLVRPLIVLPPAAAATLSAYEALKRLLHHQMPPVLANLVPEPLAVRSGATASAHALVQCATEFLGYPIEPLRVLASSAQGRSQHDVQHLALQLFENARTLRDLQPREKVH